MTAITKEKAREEYDKKANTSLMICLEAINKYLCTRPEGAVYTIHLSTDKHSGERLILSKDLAQSLKTAYTNAGWEIGDISIELVPNYNFFNIEIKGIK